ncbi:APC family permease [Phytoactinopolyspora mesophila]|uniref:APC family permease n=1 Tax=Phytoactinopolyspora mesophila TaxID=2650750 RepID=UPI001C9E51C0
MALGSAVGWGAFVLPADWMRTAGPLGAILGFLIGGLLMLVIATSYGTLIRALPVSGGEFAYTLSAFGRNHAVLCGWFLTLGYVCIVALNASALALLARYVLPEVAERALLYEVAGWEVYLGEVLIASAALVVFAVLNVRGTTLSGRLQLIFCLVMVTGVAALLVGVLIHPDGSFGRVDPLFAVDSAPWVAVLAIVAIAPWAYVGFDNVPQAAEEFAFSPRKAFRLIVFAILAAALLYSAMILVTAAATSWTDLVAEDPLWGTGDAVSDLFGGAGTTLLAVSVSMGICTGLNGFYIAASRLLFAMGRGRMIPSAFARLNPRARTPSTGIAFVCAICLIAPWFGREALLWVVDMSAVGVTIAYTYTCVVAYRMFHWSGSLRGGGAEQLGTPAKKLLSLLGAVIGCSFLALLLVPASPAALGAESLIALGVWIVIGLIIFMLRRRENAKLTDEELDYLVLDRGP